VSIVKRFKLLALINKTVASIKDSHFYLDTKLYYLLVKDPNFSLLPKSCCLYPEFRGVPIVASEGNVEYTLLNRYKNSKLLVESRDSVNLERFIEFSRSGISDWCYSWKPPDSDLSIESRKTSGHFLTALLTQNCETTRRIFQPTKNMILGLSNRNITQDSIDHEILISTTRISVLKLAFTSTKEARLRAAMLILATYDSSAQGSAVTPMNEATVMDR